MPRLLSKADYPELASLSAGGTPVAIGNGLWAYRPKTIEKVADFLFASDTDESDTATVQVGLYPPLNANGESLGKIAEIEYVAGADAIDVTHDPYDGLNETGIVDSLNLPSDFTINFADSEAAFVKSGTGTGSVPSLYLDLTNVGFIVCSLTDADSGTLFMAGVNLEGA